MDSAHSHRGATMAQARSPSTPPSRPPRDTVLYDGNCRFCRGQISILRRLDVTGQLEFTSLHDARVPEAFPGLSREEMMEEMVVVDTRGREWRGAAAVCLVAYGSGKPAGSIRTATRDSVAVAGDQAVEGGPERHASRHVEWQGKRP